MYFCRFYNPPTNQGAPGYYGYDQQQQQMPQPPVATSMAGNFSQQQQQPANFMTPAPMQQQQPRAEPPPPPAPAKPKEILPIPPEHLDLQTTFDGLRMKCLAAANHPVSPTSRLIIQSLFSISINIAMIS